MPLFKVLFRHKSYPGPEMSMETPKNSLSAPPPMHGSLINPTFYLLLGLESHQAPQHKDSRSLKIPSIKQVPNMPTLRAHLAMQNPSSRGDAVSNRL